ncbi:hypothetical protein GCM10027398_34040 [Azotobacter salinestris]
MIILGIEYAVFIAVQLTQCVETVAGLATTLLYGINSEKLTPIINEAITIQVTHYETIIALDPASSGF